MQSSPTRRLAVLAVLSATLATPSVRAGQTTNQPPPRATRQPPPSRIQVPTTKMPDLVGMPLDKARDQPVVVRFKLALTPETVASSQYPPGTIVRQSVPAGDPVRAGASIVVYVATGGLQVPSVEGQPVDVARAILQKAGFRAEVSTVVTPQFRPGIVRRQDPTPGTVRPRNSVVIIEVTLAPDRPQPPRPQPQPPQPPRPQPTYVMPDLVGRTADEAMANELVRQIKLQVTPRDDAAADGRPGLVVRQSIAPGAVVNPGAPVTVWIATGVRVPSVVGLDADGARSQLGAAGLQARAREVVRDRGRGKWSSSHPLRTPSSHAAQRWRSP
jgi:beta-lactam-binding protein with PASTA domain